MLTVLVSVSVSASDLNQNSDFGRTLPVASCIFLPIYLISLMACDTNLLSNFNHLEISSYFWAFLGYMNFTVAFDLWLKIENIAMIGFCQGTLLQKFVNV